MSKRLFKKLVALVLCACVAFGCASVVLARQSGGEALMDSGSSGALNAASDAAAGGLVGSMDRGGSTISKAARGMGGGLLNTINVVNNVVSLAENGSRLIDGPTHNTSVGSAIEGGLVGANVALSAIGIVGGAATIAGLLGYATAATVGAALGGPILLVGGVAAGVGLALWDSDWGHETANSLDQWLKDDDGSNDDMPSSGIDVYKPNIYFYSPADVRTRAWLYPSSAITKSIPEYDPDAGWLADVRGGSLNGCEDYLFYEANVSESLFQTSKGWVVEGGKHEEGLRAILALYGYSDKETADFLEFWLEMLDPDVTYAVYPQSTQRVEVIMPLVLERPADNLHRVWYYFVPLGDGPAPLPASAEPIVRDGFSVVEWGGMIAE